MATFWTTFGRQFRAYAGGSLAGGLVMTLVERILAPDGPGWLKVDLGRFSFAHLPSEILAAAVANFVMLLLPFLLVRPFVVMDAGAMSGRVGPLAAAMSGAVPAVASLLLLAGLLGDVLDIDAYSLLITSLGGVVFGLVYRRLGGFAEGIRP